eukprot:1156525-Amphidinium_carterae.1
MVRPPWKNTLWQAKQLAWGWAAGDGNCFWHSLAVLAPHMHIPHTPHLDPSCPLWMRIKAAVLNQPSDQLLDICRSLHKDQNQLNEIINSLLPDKAWGNEHAAYLAARALSVPIMILEAPKREAW